MDAGRGGGLRLHIGPGINYLPGWENIDIFSNIKADLYNSALVLLYLKKSLDKRLLRTTLEKFLLEKTSQIGH